MNDQSLYPGAELMGPGEGVDFSESVSGLFEKGGLRLKVDVDQARPFSKSLNHISGTLVLKEENKPLWSGNASAAFFHSNKDDLVIGDDSAKANLSVLLSDGEKREGEITIRFRRTRTFVLADVTILIDDGSLGLLEVPRTSQFFQEVKIDIDYVEKVIWPSIQLKDYKGTSFHMLSRELSIDSAFEDAGLKIIYKSTDSQKVVDPTPDTRWSKADMFAVMEDYFDHEEDNENIWCLMATRPPDSRYMGFSFDKDGKHGFGLFTGHTSFNGMDSEDSKVKANATRRFLHYMVHECGHCLGLSHPFEIGNPNSLTWMNYAWKYDALNGPGMFYSKFKYTFSDEELLILRHQPDKAFKDRYAANTGSPFVFSGQPRSDAPDISSFGGDEEAELDGQVPTEIDHCITFNIQFRSLPFPKGGVVEFKASLRNVGVLPCKIDPDLTLCGGNLTVFVSDPSGKVQVAKPFVSGIESPTRRYLILGNHGSRDYSDVYTDIVPLIRGSRGPIMDQAGTYTVKAVYEAGSFKVASESVSVVIVDDYSYDETTKDQVRISASLNGAASGYTSKVIDYWKQLIAKPIAEKVLRLQDIVNLLQGLNQEVIEVKSGKGYPKKRSKTRKLERSAALISAEKLIEDTADLVKYCRHNWDDDVIDDPHYSKLVLERAAILCKLGDFPAAEVEYNQLIADLVSRDVVFDFVKRISREWQKIYHPGKATVEVPSYQERVEKLIFWVPSNVAEGKQDKSGIGLGMPFNNFDDTQQERSFCFVHDLENIEDDTDDFDAVLDYAEGIIESQEVNHLVYQWAIETYIVHSKLAKKHNVRYPDPPKRNKDMTSKAAIVQTKREGQPQEQWMNYWRCDGDFNYHHRHWHAVYRGGRHFQDTKRQGELFGYMHAQLLARYDAERESWGLPTVIPYEYEEVEPEGFDAGWEFHEDRHNREVIPRPKKQIWNIPERKSGLIWEQMILSCYDEGVLPKREFGALKMNSNLAGHILEASSSTWRREFGSLHNSGHMAFCQTVDIPRGKTSYMGSTLTAVRDPIFFRWHKRVDNLYHNWNDRVKEEVGADAPGIIIEPSDALISPGDKAPKGFAEWSEKGWLHSNFKNGAINTYLEEPTLKYEWDNKLNHEPFSYHIRMRRKSGITGKLVLTVRVFICQERYIDNRRKWIEMDKFVHCLQENEHHTVVKRLDRESSVIKRTHDVVAYSKETEFVQKTVAGNCECGWPYAMMLPRGVHGGEKWVLGVIATDNAIDGIEVNTSCGSMSYCGTKDQIYPDKRTMGYPFACKMCINKKVVTISEAAKQLSNFSISPFEIHSDVAINKPTVDPLVPTPTAPLVPQIVWAPYSIVGDTGLGTYSPSRIVGRFRVLLKYEDFRLKKADRVRIHFKGRFDVPYAVSDVKIALRRENTLDVDPRCNENVLFKHEKLGEVPQEGLMSDELVLPVKPAQGNDYFVTFSLKSPGCFVYVPQSNIANSYFVPLSKVDLATNEDDWGKHEIVRKRFRSLYCIECVQGTAAV